MAISVGSIEEYEQHVGEHLGWSDWMTVTQEQVNLFADATGDHQWIHVDPERAKDGPFGGPIAHGYLTLSLIPVLMAGMVQVDGVRMGVNYGANKIRFPAPGARGLGDPARRHAGRGDRDRRGRASRSST